MNLYSKESATTIVLYCSVFCLWQLMYSRPVWRPLNNNVISSSFIIMVAPRRYAVPAAIIRSSCVNIIIRLHTEYFVLDEKPVLMSSVFDGILRHCGTIIIRVHNNNDNIIIYVTFYRMLHQLQSVENRKRTIDL